MTSPAVHGLLRADGSAPALRQLVGGLAAEALPGDGAAQHPGDPGARVVLGDAGQRDDRGGRRVPGPDHDRVPAGERLRRREVRDLVADQPGRRPLAEGGQPVGPGRVRLPPGAGRVDDRPRLQPLLGPAGAGDVHGERLVGAARVDQPVPAQARYPGHPRAVADPAAQGLRQRVQVPVAHSAPVG